METFDIVIANMLLHHVNDIDKAISEVNRVLKKGGIFYCATFGENGVVDFLASLLKDEVNQDLENKKKEPVQKLVSFLLLDDMTFKGIV